MRKIIGKLNSRLLYLGARLAASAPLMQRTGDDLQLIAQVRQRNLTYLDPCALLDLARAARAVGQGRVPGAIIEAGCALGGSAVVLGYCKPRQAPLYLYDVFGMIPPPTEQDGADIHARYQEIKDGKSSGLGGERYYGYEPELLAKVQGNLEAFGLDLAGDQIQLVQGLFEETISDDFPVALAHVDCDWYQSVLTCLERLWPRLVPGGVLVLDDYYQWSGCCRAVGRFLAGLPRGSARRVSRARLQLIKGRG